ncbi:hypothetical protein PFAG_02331 [Plasmodium falciparum Santa Lucia]|uniref:Uncharacterized protein n=4 Tax=Plasmodium falciparum TaxID=5833 RepID=A0A024W8I1_PLAFA|nr:hypothetical protein PFTANZ_02450 [Plasmodium falciparum Tanzania (2000708)]ETW43025.1 hypothetical protein PFNF135_02500 [Plasmodium falciparum NF135/5.C10]EUR72331.1 hypothetical protein PFBG_02425 [Plasmodium falciparum 7G8]EUT86462.1 hypothetical protein PFAG_02331 [Plasmodium falciparum Santa Lucia]
MIFMENRKRFCMDKDDMCDMREEGARVLLNIYMLNILVHVHICYNKLFNKCKKVHKNIYKYDKKKKENKLNII